MKNREEFWDKTLEGLDENLINETAEIIGEKSDISEDYMGAKVEIVSAGRKRFSAAPLLIAAAAVLVITGGIFAFKALPINTEENPSLTDVSETEPPVTEEIIEDNDPYGEAVCPIDWGGDLEEKMNLGLYEDYFFGKWSESESSDVLTLDYSEDMLTNTCELVRIVETEESVNLWYLDYNLTYLYRISKSDTDTMKVYSVNTGHRDDDTVYAGDLRNTYTRVVRGGGEEEKSIFTDLANGKRLGYFGRVKLLQYMSETEEKKRNYGDSAFYELTSKLIVDEETKSYYRSDFIRNKTGKDCFFRLGYSDEENLSLVVPYVPVLGGETVNMVIYVTLSEGEWVIKRITDTEGKHYSIVKPSKDVLTAEKVEEIHNNVDYDFETFDISFLGVWYRPDNFGEDIWLTYYEDIFFRGYENLHGFWQDEESFYMLSTAGGLGQLYVIDKANPDIIYYYMDIESAAPLYRDNYFEMYIRNEFKDINTDFIVGGTIGLIGSYKLMQDYGFNVYDGSEIYDGEGNKWIYGEAVWGAGTGEIYLNSYPDENGITITKRFYREDTAPDYEATDKAGDVVYSYVTLTLTRQSDYSYVVTSADFCNADIYDREKVPSDLFTKSDENTEKLNESIKNTWPDADESMLSRNRAEIEQYSDKDGRYYVYRRIGNNMAQTLEYGEVLYFNGGRYELLEGNMRGNACVEISGDRLYVMGQKLEENAGIGDSDIFLKVYRDGKQIHSEILGKGSLFMSSSHTAGDYIIFCYDYDTENTTGSITSTHQVNSRYYIFNKYDNRFNYRIIENEAIDSEIYRIDNFSTEYDKTLKRHTGFTMTENGERIIYDEEDTSLKNALLPLGDICGILADNFLNGFTLGEKKIIVNGMVYSEVRDFENHEELLSLIEKAYTEEAAAEILYNSGIGFFEEGGILYCCNNAAESGNKMDVDFSIKSVNDNSAVLSAKITDRSTGEEIAAYEVAAEKTDKGWRVSEPVLFSAKE